jgi:hypothetical protein
VDAVPASYRRRPESCTNCGDVVLIVERSLGKALGFRFLEKPKIQLEHADPAPNGEMFDAVDDGCRRKRVR